MKESMGKFRVKNKLLVAEAIAFALIIVSIWFNEIIDLPHIIFNLQTSPISWGDALLECAFVAFVGAVIMLLTWKFSASEKSERTQIVTVCAVCRKVNKAGKWMTLDEFIEGGSSASFNHGICPDCMDTYYKGVTDTTAFNFRQHLKKKG